MKGLIISNITLVLLTSLFIFEVGMHYAFVDD